jgi:hypothetical protein
MHTKKDNAKELAIDFIGTQEPLTLAEEQALQSYFKQKKATKKTTASPKQKAVK